MISIKTKTIVVFTAITIILVFVMARVSYITVKDNYLEQAAAHTRTMATYMAAALDKSYLEFISFSGGQVKEEYKLFLKAQLEQSALENAFLFNKDLQLLVFAREGISQSQLQLNRSDILNTNPQNSSVSFPFSDEEGNWYIWGFYRINDTFYLGIQESVSRLSTLNDLATIFWGIGVAGVLLTVLAGWFIAYNISGPIDKLVKFSKNIGEGDFKSKAPHKIYAEFKVLKDTMEQMKNDLASKNQEREQMLAQIAHEIRNPLGGIELLAGLVKEDLGEVHESAEHLTKILDEVQSLKNQLTAFLEYSKPLKVQTDEIDLKTVTNEIKQNFKKRITQKEINLVTENKAEKLFFDSGHFKQVINNLLTNSLDVTENGGSVWLRSSQQNGETIVSVIDAGPGISEQNKKNVFVPFFTTKANGTGLGLAVSKKLCLENNADLVFENNSGRGCTFTIKIHKKVS